MKISLFKFLIPFILLGFAFFIQLNKSVPPLNLSKQDTALNIDLNFLKLAVSPVTLLTTDLLWITTLMESDLDHYKNKDLNSWMFLRFKTITELDPNFLKAFQFGGQYLNIIKDDLEGSSYIFEKGIERFPNDYDLITGAAFLYTFELDNKKRAIELYEKAITFPKAPEYYKSILSKLRYSEEPDPTVAFNYLKGIYDNLDKGAFKYKLGIDLYNLKALIDLECLNSNGVNCNRKDFNGDNYIYSNGKYSALKKIEGFKLYRK